jgi:hypothetical protein
MNLSHTIKEDKDTITLSVDIQELDKLPLKVAMKTLELLEENSRETGYYVQYIPTVQQFIDKNKNIYKELVQNEQKEFKELSNVYFDALKGPLYIYGDRVAECVSAIYELEESFHKKSLNFAEIPKINFKLDREEGTNNLLLAVQNIDELNSKFGKAATLTSLILFKDYLNYDFQIKHKSKLSPYQISPQIKEACFDSSSNEHPHLESFVGKKYFLTQRFNEQCPKLASPEEIFKMVVLQEDVRKSLVVNKKALKF